MDGYKIQPGLSLVESMWSELDSIVDRLMTDGEAADGRDPGRAEGVAYCIALVLHKPGAVNIEQIREEAMERWERTNAE